jgi:hypothetical protein
MPIAPNPRRNTVSPGAEDDRKAEAFISKAPTAPAQDHKDDDVSLKPIMIRFPRHILARIDREAKQLGITRTAFIVQSAAEKLAKMERESR